MIVECLKAHRYHVPVAVLAILATQACQESRSPQGGSSPSGPFTAKAIDAYTALTDVEDQPGTDRPHVVGNVIAINTGETINLSRFSAREQNHHIPANTVSDAQGQLTGGASRPDDVGTVVLLKWSKEDIGETAAGTKYRLHCDVIVVDKSQRRLITKRSFVGSDPAFATLYGGSPIDQIVAYVNSLPRQASTSALTGQQPNSRGVSTAAPGTSGPIRNYLDTTNNVSFSYPAAWKQMTAAEARQVMGAANTSKYLTVLLSDPDDPTQNVNVQVLPTAAEDLTETGYKEFATSLDRQLPSGFPGFMKVTSRVGRLSDMPSLEYLFEATRPDGVRIRQKQLRTGKPGREVVITFSAKSEAYAKTDETCFGMIVKTLSIK
jgi:hypothetical protein